MVIIHPSESPGFSFSRVTYLLHSSITWAARLIFLLNKHIDIAQPKKSDNIMTASAYKYAWSSPEVFSPARSDTEEITNSSIVVTTKAIQTTTMAQHWIEMMLAIDNSPVKAMQASITNLVGRVRMFKNINAEGIILNDAVYHILPACSGERSTSSPVPFTPDLL